jgi:D-lactate dehydrogenase (cytochrome)
MKLALTGSLTLADGNYHVIMVFDPADAAALAEVQHISRSIVEQALAGGGTCTGEHGIGYGKIDFLEQEHGPAVELMRAVKRALDPTDILNPGKVVQP